MDYIPIDDWAEENFLKLLEEFDVHIRMMINCSEERRKDLVRLLMGSLRQELMVQKCESCSHRRVEKERETLHWCYMFKKYIPYCTKYAP